MVNLYLKTFVVSLVIFVLGIFIGLNMERFVASDVADQTQQIENSIQEMELEMLYFQGVEQRESCDFLNEIVRRTNINLDELSLQLSHYSEEKILFTRSNVKELKRKYTFLLIKDWLLQEKIKKDCGTDTVSILYFYDTEDCGDCLVQGNVLSLFKSSLKEKIMIFPIDVNVESSMVGILLHKYNISSRPALEIEGKVYKGIQSKDEIKKIICGKLKEKDKEICESL